GAAESTRGRSAASAASIARIAVQTNALAHGKPERCAAPTAHRTNAKPSAPPSTRMRRSELVSRLSSQASHSAVAYIGKARNCRKVDIHAPGFGRRRNNTGEYPIATKGAAKPIPSATNTRSDTRADCVSAKPSAAAINGAVQGAATT